MRSPVGKTVKQIYLRVEGQTIRLLRDGTEDPSTRLIGYAVYRMARPDLSRPHSSNHLRSLRLEKSYDFGVEVLYVIRRSDHSLSMEECATAIDQNHQKIKFVRQQAC
jgi:hypothetical protein